MENIFIIGFACLFLLPGGLIALLNWANICIWVWEKWRNNRYRKDTAIVPFLGGLLLSGGIAILVNVFPEYAVPVLKHMTWAGRPGIAAALALTGFLIDYGSIPNLIITPLLGFLFELRKAPGASTPRGPYCRELQLPYPLLLVGADDIPRLFCSAAELPPKDADFLREAPGCRLYADGLCQQIVRVHSPRKPNLWNRLRHRKAVAFWAAEAEYTTPRPYKPEKLRKLMARLIREDDDVWTQFHEGRDLLRLLKTCTSFPELLALGSLAGWWETSAANGLPTLKEDEITEADIRKAAQHIIAGN